MRADVGPIERTVTRWWLGYVAGAATLFGRKGTALEAYQRILALDPDNETALCVIGNLLADKGDTDAAIAIFHRLLRAHPGAAEGWFNLGYLLEKRDDLAEAERCFRKAVELKPSLDRAWYGLGLTLIREDRLLEAIEALRRNTKLQPFSPYGWYQLAMTHHHLGQAAEAERIYLALRKFEPRYAATLKRDLQTVPRRAPSGTQTTG